MLSTLLFYNKKPQTRKWAGCGGIQAKGYYPEQLLAQLKTANACLNYCTWLNSKWHLFQKAHMAPERSNAAQQKCPPPVSVIQPSLPISMIPQRPRRSIAALNPHFICLFVWEKKKRYNKEREHKTVVRQKLQAREKRQDNKQGKLGGGY